VRTGLYYARDGVTEWSDVVDLASDEALDRWVDIVKCAEMDDVPRPGQHCEACWERNGCEFGGYAK